MEYVDAFMKDINHISIEMSNVVRKWAPNVKVAAGVEPPVPSSARGLQGAVSELEGYVMMCMGGDTDQSATLVMQS